MNKARQLFLLLGDFIILNLALFTTIFLRYRIISHDVSSLEDIISLHQGPFAVVFILWLICFYIAGLYHHTTLGNKRNFITNALGAIAIASSLSVLFFYLNPSDITPKTNLFIFIILFTLIFLPWRMIFNIILKSYLPKNKVIFIGESPSAEKLGEELNTIPQLGWKNEGFISLENISQLGRIIQEKNITNVVLNANVSSEETQQALFECLKLKVNFHSFHYFYELITGKIPVEEIDKSWFLENLNEGKKKYYNAIKKIADLLGATISLIIVLPFWPLIALMIILDNRGPVFYTQDRVGENERVFKIIKFRTMKVNSDSVTMTAENDKRITKFGNFLRKTRLDETPQLINIIKGQMSFIGPRPERPLLITQLTEKIPFYKTRLLIKPGITGWDQVSGIYHSSSIEDTMEKLQYDLFYLKHRSIILDLSIVLKTIATVLRSGGR